MKRKSSDYEWFSFLWSADQWLVAYSILTGELSSPLLFSIGHALELYLKASYSYLAGTIHDAIRLRHDIVALWNGCKEMAPTFLQSYELREDILDKDLFNLDSREALAPSQLQHFLQNRELYTVALLLPDLKYLGTQLKNLEGPYSVSFTACNPYWMKLFREMRRFLYYLPPHMTDRARHYMEEHEIRHESHEFLSGIYYDSSEHYPDAE